MKRYLFAGFVFGSMVVLATFVFSLVEKSGYEQSIAANTSKDDSEAKLTVENYGKLPLIFEENRGQTDEQVNFLSRGADYTLFLTDSEAVMTLRGKSAEQNSEATRRDKQMPKFSVLRMKTVSSKSPSKIEGQNEQIGKSNYFTDKDSSKWLRDVPNYAKVRYSEIYSGVDLIYYGKERQLEYDFIVQPNADPKNRAQI